MSRPYRFGMGNLTFGLVVAAGLLGSASALVNAAVPPAITNRPAQDSTARATKRSAENTWAILTPAKPRQQASTSSTSDSGTSSATGGTSASTGAGSGPGSEPTMKATLQVDVSMQTVLPPPKAKQSPIGTNLAEVKDWSVQQPFADMFKTSREWIGSTMWGWGDGGPVAVDEHGWVKSLKPGQVARTIMLTGKNAELFVGEYVVNYEGQGKLTYEGAAKFTSKKGPKSDLVTVGAGESFILTITETLPSDPIRNITIIPAGLTPPEPGQFAFNPAFIERLEPYSVLRFMDWQHTNNITQVSWDSRPKLTDARWSEDHGVPAEVMFALCNQIDADPWFCMPHTADDQWVMEFAKLADELLEPERTIYIEHSNEVWNGIFQQADYARQKGLSLKLSTNDFEAQMRYHSQRSVECFNLWTDHVKPTRKIVRVMGGFVAIPWASQTQLSWKDAYKSTDALAIAPYFGNEYGLPENAAWVDAMDTKALLKDMRKRVVPEVINAISAQKKVADQFGVSLVAYESGQHLQGVNGRENSDSLNKLFDAANRHSRMADIYAEYLAGWKAQGGTLMCHFSDCVPFTKWGRWGTLEWVGQKPEQAPKFMAIVDFAKTHERWWPDLGQQAGAVGE
jgi:hypothetical protein